MDHLPPNTENTPPLAPPAIPTQTPFSMPEQHTASHETPVQEPSDTAIEPSLTSWEPGFRTLVIATLDQSSRTPSVPAMNPLPPDTENTPPLAPLATLTPTPTSMSRPHTPSQEAPMQGPSRPELQPSVITEEQMFGNGASANMRPQLLPNASSPPEAPPTTPVQTPALTPGHHSLSQK